MEWWFRDSPTNGCSTEDGTRIIYTRKENGNVDKLKTAGTPETHVQPFMNRVIRRGHRPPSTGQKDRHSPRAVASSVVISPGESGDATTGRVDGGLLVPHLRYPASNATKIVISMVGNTSETTRTAGKQL